jgi:glycosyltransferase involved in cell wall biosynthesis
VATCVENAGGSTLVRSRDLRQQSMSDTNIDISAVITTHNRSEMLAAALGALLGQNAGALRYEVVVVDNNSTDDTRAMVEGLIAKGHTNLRYVFEPQQGITYGRNAGIAAARGDIIAFTDDDVVVLDNWLTTIKRALTENPDIAYVGGKILPHWSAPPPPWLTVDHWWPLALLDPGNERFRVNASNPLCLPTANASFRREVFSRVGLFSAQFSGREDHELYLRLWHAGIEGLYEPSLVVMAEVQPERYLKSYHRRWNNKTGKFNSLSRLDEITAPDGGLSVSERRPRGVTLFGVPGAIYREFVSESLRWVRETVRRDESRTLQHENRLYYLAGYVSKRYEVTTAQENYSARADLASFVKGLFAKVVRRPETSNA